MVHKYKKKPQGKPDHLPLPHIPSITQPINLEYKFIKHPNETKYNPNNFAHFSLAANNLITLTWHDN